MLRRVKSSLRSMIRDSQPVYQYCIVLYSVLCQKHQCQRQWRPSANSVYTATAVCSEDHWQPTVDAMPVETGQATWGIYCPHCRDWHSTVLPRLLPTLVWFIVLILLQYYVSAAHIVVQHKKGLTSLARVTLTLSLLYSFTALKGAYQLGQGSHTLSLIIQHIQGINSLAMITHTHSLLYHFTA